MGNYINLGNTAFTISRNGEYVDKSGLIKVVNGTLNTENMFSCVTRSRRFGKSMAAKMLCAYYDQSCDSRHLFEDLLIAADTSFEEHLNKYPVIYLDISDFVTRFQEESIVRTLDSELRKDLLKDFPDQTAEEGDDLMEFLTRVIESTGQKFIFIIDEWDGILREFEGNITVIDTYVNWLRRLFKGGLTAKVFAGVYMTGILPIKKYNTQSALNNFREYSMVDPGEMASFFGFTKEEVRILAKKHNANFEELEKWYDGYHIGDELSMFNPNSVMMAVTRHRCTSYWAGTGAYNIVSRYITMNFKGLKDDILSLLSGGRTRVKTSKFGNDLNIITDKNDVLTVLIHLGYLSYDWNKKQCYVPNLEVADELSNALEDTEWTNVVEALQQSEELLEATIRGNEEYVARAIDAVHSDHTSILSYNDENSLACVISLAYYYARNDYFIDREMPTGYGYADLVFTPRGNVAKPALIIELKQGHSAEEAIQQIKERKYVEKIRQRTSDILLIGINYDEKSKKHTCIIEKA